MAKVYSILITGNPRSGTKYVTKMLNNVALEVAHENIGRHGMVSCFMFLPPEISPEWVPLHLKRDVNCYIRRKAFKFENVFHAVRHPLNCITSMMTNVNRRHQEWMTEIGVLRGNERSRLERIMKMWHRTNHYAAQQTKLRYRIEDLENYWPTMMKCLGLKTKYPGEIKRPYHSGKDKEPLTWDDLYAVDYSLTEEIRKQARRYGYAV